MNYDVAALRNFIFDHFNDEGLTTLCQEYFPDVYKNFAAGQTFRQRIQLLLDYCLRSERQMKRLVAALYRKRPQAYESTFPSSVKVQVMPPMQGPVPSDPDPILPPPPPPPSLLQQIWQKAAGVPSWRWGVLALALAVLLVFGMMNGLGGGGEAMPTPSLTPSPTATWDPKLSPPPNPEVSDTWVRPSDGMEMVYLPAGTFLMGSVLAQDSDANDDESPPRLVALDGFWMGRIEVTNAMYAQFLNERGNQEEEGVTWLEVDSSDALVEEQTDGFVPRVGFADHPVVAVSWYGARAYCQWVGGQLPTEAQWEYGARGENGRIYPWGDSFDDTRANYCDSNCNLDWSDSGGDDGYARTAPVGSFSPEGDSPFGLADMAGNVWEWTADWYDADYYENGLTNNPIGPPSGDQKVLRGGSWNSIDNLVRAAYRSNPVPTFRDNDVGFRCAQAAAE